MQRGVNGAMGQVIAEFTVANNADLLKAAEGNLPPDQVRQVKVKGIVDTGANWLVLPKAVADQLGLPPDKPMLMEFGEGRLQYRNVAEQAQVEILGRHGTFRAIIDPDRTTALIGAIVLGDLDLLVDYTHQTLRPRDPNYMVAYL